jgi:tetratricopeptide (TPR) repeat protein
MATVERVLATQGVDKAEQAARAACAAPGGAEAELALANVLLRKHGDAALAEAEQLLADKPDAIARQLTGIAHARRGRAREALEAFEEAYKLADGNPALRARILLAWALQLRNFGLFEDAQRLAERSLELRLQLDDHEGAAMCYGTLAFIAQRQGRFEAERDALVADLRLVERLGNHADVPALQARLAGALVGLGKYAGAWAEADKALALETGLVAAGVVTRTHGFAWREQARVCLAGSRFDEGLALVDKAAQAFAGAKDPYGAALVRITEAELALASGDHGRAREAIAAARPAFVSLGALPELAETVLLEVEIDGERTEEALVQRLLPALVTAGITSALHRRTKETLARLAPAAAFERAAAQAGMLRGIAATAALDAPTAGTVIAARVPVLADARRFVRAAVDAGAIVTVGVGEDALAIVVGANHEARAQKLSTGLAGLALATATGTVELERLWPAGVRARGEAVTAAVKALP